MKSQATDRWRVRLRVDKDTSKIPAEALERPHWSTRVWLDEREVGSGESLSTPHRFELRDLSPGVHRLTVRVDSRLVADVGVNAHSVTDRTQTNWNGITGDLALEATGPVWIDEVAVFPEVAGRRVKARLRIVNGAGASFAGRIHL